MNSEQALQVAKAWNDLYVMIAALGTSAIIAFVFVELGYGPCAITGGWRKPVLATCAFLMLAGLAVPLLAWM